MVRQDRYSKDKTKKNDLEGEPVKKNELKVDAMEDKDIEKVVEGVLGGLKTVKMDADHHLDDCPECKKAIANVVRTELKASEVPKDGKEEAASWGTE